MALGGVQVSPGHLQLPPHLFQPPSQVTLGLPKLLVLRAGLLVCAAEAVELGLQLQEVEGEEEGSPGALQGNKEPPKATVGHRLQAPGDPA